MEKQNTAGLPGQPGFGHAWSPCYPQMAAVEIGLDWAVVLQGGCGLIFDENMLHIATVPNYVYFGEDGKPDGGGMVQRLAALIAAAPDLLDALKDLREAVKSRGVISTVQALSKADAAIAKVKGGTA